MRRTILIGDVHGCVDEAEDLLRACGYSKSDHVVFVGDLVAKGPDSAGVVQLAREVNARGVRGNHDHHLLSWKRKGNDAKPLKPYHQKAADGLTDADWKWLESLPLVMRLPEHRIIVVHAGFAPGQPINQQRAEHLLNIRSVTRDGRPSKRIDDGVPWASTWEGPDEVVFGHDAMRGLQQHPFAIGLDTGCVYGYELTAFILPERRFVRVPARRQYCLHKSKE